MANRKLLVTDLDNTLYDWVTYFAQSFYTMVDELVALLQVDREELLDGFKEVHQRYENSEHPFAVLEVTAIRRKFANSSDAEILNAIDPALHAFNRSRQQTLKLYDGVLVTLSEIARTGTVIVGHTEAVVPNAYFRIETLGIRPLLKHLYALEGAGNPHPRGGTRLPPPAAGFVRTVPTTERKPNPALLLDICKREGVAPSDTWYVGDSLTRDMSMARSAGVNAVWARYGTSVNRAHWEPLVRITHWGSEDVKREAELKKLYADIKPDHAIDRFEELLTLMG